MAASRKKVPAKKQSKSKVSTKAKKPLLSSASSNNIWSQKKVFIGLLALVLLVFGGYMYYQKEFSSASVSYVNCGDDGQDPCWKQWPKLGEVVNPNGVAMSGYADIAYKENLSYPDQSGLRLSLKVWPSDDQPGYRNSYGGGARYEIIAFYGPLTADKSGVDLTNAISWKMYFVGGSMDRSKSRARTEILVDGAGSIPAVTEKDPVTGKDNYLQYGFINAESPPGRLDFYRDRVTNVPLVSKPVSIKSIRERNNKSVTSQNAASGVPSKAKSKTDGTK